MRGGYVGPWQLTQGLVETCQSHITGLRLVWGLLAAPLQASDFANIISSPSFSEPRNTPLLIPPLIHGFKLSAPVLGLLDTLRNRNGWRKTLRWSLALFPVLSPAHPTNSCPPSPSLLWIPNPQKVINLPLKYAKLFRSFYPSPPIRICHRTVACEPGAQSSCTRHSIYPKHIGKVSVGTSGPPYR